MLLDLKVVEQENATASTDVNDLHHSLTELQEVRDLDGIACQVANLVGHLADAFFWEWHVAGTMLDYSEAYRDTEHADQDSRRVEEMREASEFLSEASRQLACL